MDLYIFFLIYQFNEIFHRTMIRYMCRTLIITMISKGELDHKNV